MPQIIGETSMACLVPAMSGLNIAFFINMLLPVVRPTWILQNTIRTPINSDQCSVLSHELCSVRSDVWCPRGIFQALLGIIILMVKYGCHAKILVRTTRWQAMSAHKWV